MTGSSQSSVATLGALVSQEVHPQAVPGDLWSEVIRLALQHGLGPMLLWATKQAAPETVMDPLWNPLVSAARKAAIRHVWLENAQRQVHAALAVAEIPSVWLKGIVLARTVYPQPALRPMGDLDVLVPYEQRQLALSVVQSLGYHFYSSEADVLIGWNDELAVKLKHAYTLKGGVADAVILDLNYWLLGSEHTSPLSPEQLTWFWSQLQILDEDNGFTLLKPEAHLLYLCAHAALQHGEAQFFLLRYFDLHRLITEETLDWKLVVDQAVALGWTYAVERALELATHFFCTPVPAWVFAQLQDRRPTYEDVSRVVSLQGKGARWGHMKIRLASLSPVERVLLILKVIFPRKAYMRRRYSVKPNRPVWPYYLYRWFDQGQEVVAWMWGRLTGRARRTSRE